MLSKYQRSLMFLVIPLSFMCINSVFSQIDIKKHKKLFFENLEKDPSRMNDPWYPVARVRLTINADDSDYIPKVPHAGKIFDDGVQPYQLMHNGVKVMKDCYYGNSCWMSDIIYALRGHHEPQEEKAFYEVLKNIPANATMIELGCYWAYYSLWFQETIPGAVNYLIEPNAYRMGIGKKNFELNNRNGFFIQAYAGRSDNDGANTEALETISIDGFLEREGINHLHMLHSDIQGAEFEMLKTAKKSIEADKIDYFFISTHGDWVHDDCANFLKSHGCHIIVEHSYAESCSVDGLIVARGKHISGPNEISIRRYNQ